MLDTQSPFLPRSTGDGVFLTEEKMRSSIISGELAPGARLSEVALCEAYGQGRGTVRAALGRLAHGGFVVSRPRSGWKVAPVSAAGIREVILARGRLETLLADALLAVEDLARIQTIGDMQAALMSAPSTASSDNVVLQRRYDRQIRDILAQKLNAPLIAAWLANLWDKSERYLNYFETRGSRRMQASDWSPFIEAKRRADYDAAAAALSEGCQAFTQFVQARLLESDLAAPEIQNTSPRSSRAGSAPRHSPDPGERTLKRTI